MRKMLISVTGGAAAVLLAAGCASAPSPQAQQRQREAVTCRNMAFGTQFADAGAGFDDLSAATVPLEDAPAGYLSAAMTRHLRAVTQTGLYNPSPAAVAALQADCDAVKVTARVWPESLTAAG